MDKAVVRSRMIESGFDPSSSVLFTSDSLKDLPPLRFVDVFSRFLTREDGTLSRSIFSTSFTSPFVRPVSNASE